MHGSLQILRNLLIGRVAQLGQPKDFKVFVHKRIPPLVVGLFASPSIENAGRFYLALREIGWP